MGLCGQIHERVELDALRTLDGFIDTVIADEAVKGAIITSGKKISPLAWI